MLQGCYINSLSFTLAKYMQSLPRRRLKFQLTEKKRKNPVNDENEQTESIAFTPAMGSISKKIEEKLFALDEAPPKELPSNKDTEALAKQDRTKWKRLKKHIIEHNDEWKFYANLIAILCISGSAGLLWSADFVNNFTWSIFMVVSGITIAAIGVLPRGSITLIDTLTADNDERKIKDAIKKDLTKLSGEDQLISEHKNFRKEISAEYGSLDKSYHSKWYDFSAQTLSIFSGFSFASVSAILNELSQHEKDSDTKDEYIRVRNWLIGSGLVLTALLLFISVSLTRKTGIRQKKLNKTHEKLKEYQKELHKEQQDTKDKLLRQEELTEQAIMFAKVFELLNIQPEDVQTALLLASQSSIEKLSISKIKHLFTQINSIAEEKIVTFNKDGTETAFEVHETKGDGSCGYYALPIPEDRKGAAKLLYKHSEDAEIRAIVAPEIKNAFFDDSLPKKMKEEQIYKDLYKRYLECISVKNKAIRHANNVLLSEGNDLEKLLALMHNQEQYRTMYAELLSLKEDETRLLDDLNRYCNDKEIFKAFVEDYIGGKGELSFFANQVQTESSSLTAIAMLKGLKVYIFQKVSGKENKIDLLTSCGQEDGIPVYLLHRRGINTHFELMHKIYRCDAKPSLTL